MPKLTASEIAYTLYPHPKDSPKKPKGIPDGQTVHEILGYDNTHKLRRTYKHNNGATRHYSVRGMPDKYDGNIVTELKTFWDKDYKKTQEGRGEVQLQTYLWLAQEPYGELHLYDIPNQMMEEIPIEYDQQLFQENIDKVIDVNYPPYK